MLPNGSSVVQRDVRYQAASLDRRRQDIERRIGDLEDRIAGAAVPIYLRSVGQT